MRANQTEPRYLRLGSLVDYSGLSESKIRSLMRQGRIPSLLLDGVRLFDTQDFDRFVDQFRQP
jgi:predicted DNA-binding transcriptional regulator AlpA